MPPRETRTDLLDAAQRMVQERGFNAFSYKDLAALVGIRTASIHYHFPAKGDLAAALMQRYLDELEAALAELDRRKKSEKARLEGFIAFYRSTQDCGGLCLCGSLASDFGTLPEPVQTLVRTYLERSRAWVRGVIDAGRETGEFDPAAKPLDLAATLIAGLQGALLLARASDGLPAVQSVQRAILGSLGAA